jgi:hypothetical protein
MTNLFVVLLKSNRKQTEQLENLLRKEMKENREELGRNMRELRTELNQALSLSTQQMQTTLHRNLMTTNEMQREKFEAMNRQQDILVKSTEKRLDEMRIMVEEKLQKTLNERIGQSFELVRSQLENVQKGLGEMKNLAEDVGGLKKVLGNVKTRGTFGEIQLAALLEQMLSPEQYEANVKTRKNATEFVEFAIKLPGKDNGKDVVYLPIDAKFPKDVYEQYMDAYEEGDTTRIESTSKQLEITIKRMAKDIHEKYVEPPYTTDFAIMFLPFESIYAEVAPNIRPDLVEEDMLSVIGRMKNGVIFSLDPSWSKMENRLKVPGPGWEVFPKRMEVNITLSGENGTLMADCFGPNVYHSGCPNDRYTVQYTYFDEWVGLIDEFVDNIRNKKTPLINLEWHKRTIEAMNACYESIATGKVVKL